MTALGNLQSRKAVDDDVRGTRNGQAVGKVEESHGSFCTTTLRMRVDVAFRYNL